MRNVMILAIAAGLVLPTAANARPASEYRPETGIELRGNAGAKARVASPADRRAARQDAAQNRREDRRDVRRDRREDTRDARQYRHEDARDARQYRREDAREARRDVRQEARRDRREEARRETYRGAYREARQDVRRDYRRDQRRQYRDWRAYRQAERQAFRRGAYYAPRGYSYRRLGVGQTLFANVFWGQRYWVDPYDYYLPQPRSYNERWIRYGNDVLLIDTRNGRVLTVYDDFFW